MDDPASQVHEPEVDDVVRVVRYGVAGRRSVAAEYVIPAGEGLVAELSTWRYR